MLYILNHPYKIAIQNKTYQVLVNPVGFIYKIKRLSAPTYFTGKSSVTEITDARL